MESYLSWFLAKTTSGVEIHPASAFTALLQCFTLAAAYVGSLHLRPSPYPRDHSSTIKQRICRVTLVCIFALVFMIYVSEPSALSSSSSSSSSSTSAASYTLWTKLGFSSRGTIHLSAGFPLLLTMVLFTGPIALEWANGGIGELWDHLVYREFLGDWVFYRTFVVAPITEEFVFRACMLPLLTPHYGTWASIMIAPLFFGLAHVHHVREQLRMGHSLGDVLPSTILQLSYTSVFGAYSAYLFLRTGSIFGPIVTHMFCNGIGFPDFGSIPTSGYPKFIISTFIFGLWFFFKLVGPLTDPALYNSIYWTSG